MFAFQRTTTFPNIWFIVTHLFHVRAMALNRGEHFYFFFQTNTFNTLHSKTYWNHLLEITKLIENLTEMKNIIIKRRKWFLEWSEEPEMRFAPWDLQCNRLSNVFWLTEIYCVQCKKSNFGIWQRELIQLIPFL